MNFKNHVPSLDFGYLLPGRLLSATDARRSARRAVALLFFVNGALLANWVSRIPAIQSERQMSHGMLGLALLCMALGALLAMPLSGWYATRIGSRRVSCVTAVVYCVALPLLLLMPTLWGFMLALFCFGAAHGGLDVAMNAQAVAVEKRYQRPIMSSFHALFSLGGLFGAVFGAVLASAELTPLAHFSLAAILLGGTAALAMPRLLETVDRKTPESRSPTRERNKSGWPPRSLLILGVIAFCVMLGEGAMADWSALYLKQSAGASEGFAALGYAAFSISMALGRIFGDRLSMRWGSVNIVRFGGAIAATGLTLALLVDSPPIAVLGFAVVGAGFSTVVPQVFSSAGRTPGISPDFALATVTTLGYFGFLLGPPFIGLVAELIHLQAALGIIVMASVTLCILAPEVKRSH